jgi:hypothetical protein
LCGLVGACRTPGTQSFEDDGSYVRDTEAEGPTPAVALESTTSAPFASGEVTGLQWEVRFNFPPCEHEGQPKGAYCTIDDYKPAIQKNGVEARLMDWLEDPKTKSVKLAYFSFSNKNIKKALCVAAERGVKIDLYLHRQNVPTVQDLSTCSPNLKVHARGTEFGSGYLQHAKIFLASELDAPKPLADMTEDEAQAVRGTKTRFTSSSANMSSYGTALHFENWLFFTAETGDYLAQDQLCFFKAMETMEIGTGVDERASFAKINSECRQQITATPRTDVRFMAVPHGNLTPKPFDAMKQMISGAQQSVKVAIHRLTMGGIAKSLAQKAQQGRDVKVLFDDDTFRAGQCNGGAAMDVGAYDTQSMRTIRDGGGKIGLVATNGALPHLHHNKFIIVDDKILFQGAGNFTSTSLNAYDLGNMEHFYVITAPEIVAAYGKAWDYLNSISLLPSEHEVGGHKEKGFAQGSNGMLGFDDSGCI